ncbi:enhanced serine sensitivity protein SseB C-terminal domain-containing protein [Rhodanobacter sp. DHG33]|uniref:enhanced serine sensitivity protein SseB C-terminal domain-containing protein n=1 Tax=Rhodanobacter sp. DHG33 TaxID=2775921 RepID=UPI00177E0EF6|nr:enhanced serine sensitivity protein SseB C-terminal domain-containing protein [Rhodanobacter sp. DHG33]MBD8898555.1 enhanced serine sensitivity protein SseB C-terminal domain-containing protein [Rhodanobacter sp. DHG33]
MRKVAGSPLDALIDAARAVSTPAESAAAEQAFFNALLDATVYAHVPTEPAPPDRIRFMQFVRPDNGQTVLPFFSDQEQASVAAAGQAAIVAMSGRRLFELTRGATLMLNPNRDHLTLYPPEIGALLEGRPLGVFSHETVKAGEKVGLCPPSVPTDALVLALRSLFEREPSVRAGYLVEVHRGADYSDVLLLLTLVVTKGNVERMVQLTSMALRSATPPPLPVTMSCVLPDEPLPELCHHGIQFYGT